MTGHRALEKKQITQGNNRKVQNPSGSQINRVKPLNRVAFFVFLLLELCWKRIVVRVIYC